jgi:CHAT domain-containing protein/Tfp pilus assembly protein PilF
LAPEIGFSEELMLKLNSRLLMRRIAISCVSLALTVPVTTFSGTYAAQPAAAPAKSPAKNTMEAVFVLPPDREQTPETVGLVTKLLEDGRKAYEKKEFERAVSKFQEAYGLAREIKYTDGEGMALTEMCLFYQEKNQLPRAKELGENAIEVLYNSADKKSLGKARVALARVYLLLDNTQMAMQQLGEALTSFNDVSATDGDEIAKVLMIASDIAVRTGHEKEAVQFSEAAAGYAGQAGKTRDQVALQVRIANYFITTGALTAGLEEANKALAAARNAQKPSNAEIACALNAVANAQYVLCQYADARKTYEELLRMKVPEQTAVERAIYTEGYAFTLIATGDYDLAKDAFEKALPVIKTQSTVAHRAQVLNGLGIIAAHHGDNQSAITYFKQALDAAALINPKQPRLLVTITQNVASAQARAGENRNAKVQIGNALVASHNKTHRDPVLEARTLAGLADICLNLKEYPEAEQAIQKGLEIAQRINDDASLWRLYTSLAQVQLATDVPATESLQSALSFFRSPQAGDFASPAALTYPTRRDEKGQELVSLLVSAGMIEQALLAAEQLKEESFINEWLRRGGEVRQSDRDIYNDMVTRRAHLHAVEASSLPSTAMKEWRDWVTRFQHIAAENPGLARLIAPVPISLTEVIKTAGANRAAVIDYLVGNKWTIMFTLDTQRRLTAHRLNVGKDELQKQVASLLTASAKSDEAARTTEHRLLQVLYNELLPEEARRVLPTNPEQMVVVIPDSVLFNLPFAALVSPQGKYLVETHTLTMAPSLNILMDAPHHSGDMSVVMASQTPAQETSQISSVFDPQQVVTLSGKDSEILKLQEQAKSSSIIHFSGNVQIPHSNALNSPIPLPATQPGDKVTANSLFDLHLPSDLAVLSGTSVNARDYKGHGVQVFARGLNYAGVRNVLMSLWAAPDPGRTSELVEFYRGQNKGMSQAQSLRKAQLLALSKDPSPRSWAAFQLLGPGF